MLALSVRNRRCPYYDPVEFVQNCQGGRHRETWTGGWPPQHVGYPPGLSGEMS
jgi:hypothetical protein